MELLWVSDCSPSPSPGDGETGETSAVSEMEVEQSSILLQILLGILRESYGISYPYQYPYQYHLVFFFVSFVGFEWNFMGGFMDFMD